MTLFVSAPVYWTQGKSLDIDPELRAAVGWKNTSGFWRING
jgi:hypothetical protein